MTTSPPIAHGAWQQVLRTPLAIWLGLIVVDSVVDSADQEALAFRQSLVELARDYPSNELVQRLAKDAPGPSIRQRQGRSSSTEEQLTASIERAIHALDEHAPATQARACRDFLYRFGYRVAEAATESFLQGGLRVSQPEEAFLHKLRRILLPDADAAR